MRVYCAICGCSCNYTGFLDHEREHGHSFSAPEKAEEASRPSVSAPETPAERLVRLWEEYGYLATARASAADYAVACAAAAEARDNAAHAAADLAHAGADLANDAYERGVARWRAEHPPRGAPMREDCAVCGCLCGNGSADPLGSEDHEYIHGHSFSAPEKAVRQKGSVAPVGSIPSLIASNGEENPNAGPAGAGKNLNAEGQGAVRGVARTPHQHLSHNDLTCEVCGLVLCEQDCLLHHDWKDVHRIIAQLRAERDEALWLIGSLDRQATISECVSEAMRLAREARAALKKEEK